MTTPKPPKHPHPAGMWPTRWIFHDRRDEPAEMQTLDLLTDIRNMMLVLIILDLF